MSDALSRLQAEINIDRITDAKIISVLKALYNYLIDLHDYEKLIVLFKFIEVFYYVILIKMTNEFKKRLKKAYAQNFQ